MSYEVRGWLDQIHATLVVSLAETQVFRLQDLWRDAAEFIALGCDNVQVCTAVMHYGFRIVEDMIDGLSNWMDDKGYKTLADFKGKAVPSISKGQF